MADSLRVESVVALGTGEATSPAGFVEPHSRRRARAVFLMGA